MTLNWTNIVNNFETVVLYWTAVSLCWGVGTTYVYNSMKSKVSAAHNKFRKIDQHNIRLVWLINIVCLAYLAISPLSSFLNTSFIVINIFYTNFLAYISIHLYQWSISIKNLHNKQLTNT